MNGVDVFEFKDYKAFVWARIKAAPKGGRGELARISESTGVHKTTLSQILRGSKDFSLEQALKLASHLGLGRAESDYFLLLVNFARAGSHDLKQMFARQIDELKRARLALANRVTRSRELTSEERSIYYSNWIYSAVRNLTAIDEFRAPAALAKRLNVRPAVINRILEFLTATGLCVQKGGLYSPGPQMTHLEAESPLVSRHHGNWRVKAMERHPVLSAETEVAYTAPMTLSAADVAKVRALLADVVQRTDEIVGPSPSERLYCLNIDWFEVL